MNAIQPLRPGDPAPRFLAPTGQYPLFQFDQAAGRYVVLSFFGSLQTPQMRGAIDQLLASHHGLFDDANVCFFGVSTDPADLQAGLLRDVPPGTRYFLDFEGAVSKLYGVLAADGNSYQPTTLVLDRLLRVIAVIPIDADHARNFDQALARVRDMAAQPGLQHHAPILGVPRVFEEDFCAHLIAQFESIGGKPSGVMEDGAGQSSEVLDADIKRRRDVTIADDGLRREIWARLQRRLFPLVQQAFQFQATNLERYMVACYDAANSGFFAPHRDDTTKVTAHRRFAVTINLNSDYEGGDLMFPEFGYRAYRPPPGGAVVFSCSLLHMVAPVQRGRRFAFLPFLHDDKAEAVREENMKFHGGAVLQRT